EDLHAGAGGCLLKYAPPEERVRAERVVAAGDALLTPGITRRMIAQFAARRPRRPREGALLSRLTEREREVLLLIAQGRSNREVGEELFISDHPVKTHVGRLLTKLGLRDRVQLVIFAYDNGLVSPAP